MTIVVEVVDGEVVGVHASTDKSLNVCVRTYYPGEPRDVTDITNRWKHYGSVEYGTGSTPDRFRRLSPSYN